MSHLTIASILPFTSRRHQLSLPELRRSHLERLALSLRESISLSISLNLYRAIVHSQVRTCTLRSRYRIEEAQMRENSFPNDVERDTVIGFLGNSRIAIRSRLYERSAATTDAKRSSTVQRTGSRATRPSDTVASLLPGGMHSRKR